MRRQSLIWVGVVVVGSALGWGAWVRGQQPAQPVKVEVTVPAVPNVPSLGTVVPSQPPSELAVVPRGIVYVGHRGAYHLASAGHEGQGMFRDANNLFWAKSLTYYGMNNGYWIASVNGAPDTFLAFQATPMSAEAPFYKVLIHTGAISGYADFDEATRGNAQ
jgi:hypothetical protein